MRSSAHWFLLVAFLLLPGFVACAHAYLGERGVNHAKKQIDRYGECSLFNGAHVVADTARIDAEGRLHLTMRGGKVRVSSWGEGQDQSPHYVSFSDRHHEFDAEEVILTAVERGGLEVVGSGKSGGQIPESLAG